MTLNAEIYPQHAKLRGLDGANQTIGNFLEWLSEKNFAICTLRSGGGYNEDYVPSRNSNEKWLAEYFEIDLVALENEKRAMIAAHVKATEQ